MIGLGWVNVYATGRIQTGFRLERRRENLKISLLQYAADVDYKRAGSYEGINRETLCFLYSNNVSNLILPNFHELYDPIRGKWDYIVNRLTSLFRLFVLPFVARKNNVGSSCNDDLVSRSLFFLSFILTIKQNVVLFFFLEIGPTQSNWPLVPPCCSSSFDKLKLACFF